MNYRLTFHCPACNSLEYKEVDMVGKFGRTSCTACGCGIDIIEKNIGPLLSQITIEAVPPESEENA
jgi:transcription elongation factor Elf1